MGKVEKVTITIKQKEGSNFKDFLVDVADTVKVFEKMGIKINRATLDMGDSEGVNNTEDTTG